jgi:hypothetical protein
MPTIGGTVLTLADHAKRLEPGKEKFATVIETLSQKNEILQDMSFLTGNLTTGHRTVVRTGYPSVFFRNYNGGVLVSKSTTATIDEKCAMLEAYSEVDIALAKLGGEPEKFRLTEAMAFVEAMGQTAARTIFYGNSGVNPEEFDGLTMRYSSLTAPNARNIVNGLGATANQQASIWLVVHGEQSFHGIVPQGSTVGLDHIDHGMRVIDVAGTGFGTQRMTVYQDQWKWDMGVALKDWRQVVRICNIDIPALLGATPPDLINLMIRAMHKIEAINLGKASFYMNRTLATYLDIIRLNKAGNAGLDYKDVDGKWTPVFRGVPIKTVDQLLVTESVVS